MRTDQAPRQFNGRPAHMAALGLLPPYTVADVKHAYFVRAKAAHPDRGGDNARFVCLQDAFEQAERYARARGSHAARIRLYVDHYLQVTRRDRRTTRPAGCAGLRGRSRRGGGAGPRRARS